MAAPRRLGSKGGSGGKRAELGEVALRKPSGGVGAGGPFPSPESARAAWGRLRLARL